MVARPVGPTAVATLVLLAPLTALITWASARTYSEQLVYVQHESPGADKESNWLPAPKDKFNLAMRLYFPKREIIDGSWKIPSVKREGARPKTEAA